ncbi:MAG: hypothetical protein ACREMB_22625 [Candidatus Rokuibacteriota bacterium]
MGAAHRLSTAGRGVLEPGTRQGRLAALLAASLLLAYSLVLAPHLVHHALEEDQPGEIETECVLAASAERAPGVVTDAAPPAFIASVQAAAWSVPPPAPPTSARRTSEARAPPLSA